MFVCGLRREEGFCVASACSLPCQSLFPHLDVLLASIGSVIRAFTKWFIHSTPARPLGLGPQPALEDP